MKTSTGIKINGLVLIGIACLLSGIFFIRTIALRHQFDYNGAFSAIDSPDTIITEGFIKDVLEPPKDSNTYTYNYIISGDPNYGTVYSYCDEKGEAYTVTINVFSSNVKKGDKMDVYYNKYDPEKSVPAFLFTSYNFLCKLFTIISIVSFIPGLIFLIIGFIVGKKEKSQLK